MTLNIETDHHIHSIEEVELENKFVQSEGNYKHFECNGESEFQDE